MNPLTQSNTTTILPVLIALTLGCFGLSPQAGAVCQEGCLTNSNTALGDDALINNFTGSSNTATGAFALRSNSAGGNNTATGTFALNFNTTGGNNTAIGFDALEDNTTGANNTAVGLEALWSNTTGDNNIALGFQAGTNLTTGDNNIDIGNAGVEGESGIIRIGTPGTHRAAVIAGVSKTIATGQPVIVNPEGRLGIMASSKRFKDAIEPMDKASEAILALQPVTFRYKHELDPDGIPQFGLVAEEVAKVNPDLVARDEAGEPYTVRYEAVNAMLLNEFLKEHHTVQEQGAAIAELKKQIANLTATVKEQAAQIQKVSAQIELSKPATRTVGNNQ